MLLSSIQVSGLAGAPHAERTNLGSVVFLPHDAEGVALADGLALLRAAIDPTACAAALRVRGLAGSPEVTLAAGRPDEVDGFDPGAVRAWLAPGTRRAVRVTATCEVDPPLFGHLRRVSARDPRLALALGESPSIELGVGWLFTTDLRVASPSVTGLRVGGTTFPVGGTEAVPWLGELLAELARRLGEWSPRPEVSPADRMIDAMLSAEPAVREGFARASRALAAHPAALPPIQLVRSEAGDAVAFGPELARPRQLGPRAERAVSLVVATCLDAPDVLLVPDAPDAETLGWLRASTEGDDATLEQLFVFGASEGPAVAAPTEPDETPARGGLTLSRRP